MVGEDEEQEEEDEEDRRSLNEGMVGVVGRCLGDEVDEVLLSRLGGVREGKVGIWKCRGVEEVRCHNGGGDG